MQVPPAAQSPLAAKKVKIKFENVANSSVSVTVMEDTNNPNYNTWETPVGKLAPGTSGFTIPAHHGRTFIFKQDGKVIHTHTVDVNEGEDQFHMIGRSTEL